LFDFFMAQSSQSVEPPQKPGRFKLAGARSAELLLKSTLTSRYWADRSAWRPDAVAKAVKLLHVAVMREYDFLSHAEDAQKVLGSDAISIQVFDRWWTLRELDFDEPSEHWESYLAALSGNIVPTDDPLVDEWVKERSSRA
jgi:hypothetical protein